MEKFAASLENLTAPWESQGSPGDRYDLRLRPVAAEDAPAVFAACQDDPKLLTGLDSNALCTLEEAERFAAKTAMMWKTGNPAWAIEIRKLPSPAPAQTHLHTQTLAQDWEFAGILCLSAISSAIFASLPALYASASAASHAAPHAAPAADSGFREYAISFWVSVGFRHHGVATWATRLALKVAFEQLSAHRVVHLTRVDNWSALAVARACGFTREGECRYSLPASILPTTSTIPTATTAAPAPTAQIASPALNQDGRQVVSYWQSGILIDDYLALAGTWPIGGNRQTTAIDGTRPQALVAEFHNTYAMPDRIRDHQPTTLDYERLDMRMSLIAEEAAELFQAVYGGEAETQVRDLLAHLPDLGERDPIETADALGDLVYVIYGMALESGIDLDAVLAEIHRSNLSKLMPDGSVKRREDGKVLKGPNFSPPDIARVLADHQIGDSAES